MTDNQTTVWAMVICFAIAPFMLCAGFALVMWVAYKVGNR